jgi:hypothetical protein
VIFEACGFESAFTVEVEPAFPGDGNWGHPVFGYGHDGLVVDPFTSRWGTPVVLGVHPDIAPAWIGMFAGGGLGQLTGVFGCPGRDDLCLVADGDAYLIDVTQPEAGAVIAQNMVWQVETVPDPNLLLLVCPWDIAAIGSDGVAWRTGRLAVDELRIEQADTMSIVCRLDNLGGTPTIELDPKTGEQMSGTRLDWPSDPK